MKLSVVVLVILVDLMSLQLVDLCGPFLPSHPFDLTRTNKTKQLGYLPLRNIVKLGARRGIEECQKQFNESSPWNCAFVNRLVDPELPIFVNTTLSYATKETAFIHAISAAAITYELTLKCRHNIRGCKCKRPKLPHTRGKNGGTWTGCGDNVEFGEYETRRFFENLEKGNDARTAVNLHNNKVGREVVVTSLVYWCECFGYYAACYLKKCWKILAPFEKIGAKLKQKYHDAVRVWFVDNKLYERIGDQFRVISNNDTRLVYLDPFFPDFCVRNDTMGFRGMQGMTFTSDDVNNWVYFIKLCILCKLRPETVEYYKHFECKSKFHYCYHLKCPKTCREKYSVTTCNSYTVEVGTNKK